MKTIFQAVFAFVAVFHLVSLLFRREKIQNLTKVLIVPLVLAVYLSTARSVSVPVVIALLCGWAGDILLLKIADVLFFRLGLAAFLLGHICYIIAMLGLRITPDVSVLAISGATALVLGVCAYRLVRPDRQMKIPALVYEAVLLFTAVCALQIFIAAGLPFGVLLFAGSLCFLVSDTLLALFTFGTQPRYGQFLVMLTYIPAQLCIALGFCGL